jgi:hypothetical protein
MVEQTGGLQADQPVARDCKSDRANLNFSGTSISSFFSVPFSC